jgi:hypothetical protein
MDFIAYARHLDDGVFEVCVSTIQRQTYLHRFFAPESRKRPFDVPEPEKFIPKDALKELIKTYVANAKSLIVFAEPAFSTVIKELFPEIADVRDIRKMNRDDLCEFHRGFPVNVCAKFLCLALVRWTLKTANCVKKMTFDAQTQTEEVIICRRSVRLKTRV